MSEPFLAEIKIVGFNFAPRGWAFCDGQILPINQNQSLYSLLGTTYGGDGRTSFGLPELRGRTPVHPGNGITLGQKGGEEQHRLTVAEMPSHGHTPTGVAANGTAPNPAGSLFAQPSNGSQRYAANSGAANLRGTSQEVGGGQGHENMQPYQVLYFCIALQGLFPSRN